MGSQIFDYWYVLFIFPGEYCSDENCRFDPSGFIVEHYIDGDLLDETQPTNRSLASPNNLHIWGRLSFLSTVTFASDIKDRPRFTGGIPGVIRPSPCVVAFRVIESIILGEF